MKTRLLMNVRILLMVWLFTAVPLMHVHAQQSKDSLRNKAEESFATSPLFTQILDLYKKSLEAYVKGDYPAAIINAQKALLLDPLEEECYLLLKQSKARIGIVEKEGNPPGGSAIDSAEQKNMFMRGMQLYLQKDYDGAKRRWELLGAINSNYPEIKKWLSQADLAIVSADSAGRSAARALKYFQEALTLYEKKNNVKALAYLDTTLSVFPGQIEAMMLRGRIQVETQGEYQLLLEAGKAQYASGDYYKAIETWKKGMALASDKTVLSTLLAETERQIDDIKNLYMSEGLVYAEKNDYSGAIESFRKVLAVTPDDQALKKRIESLQIKMNDERNGLFQAAMADWQSGDYRKAGESFSKVLAIAPDYAPAREFARQCAVKNQILIQEERIAGDRKKAVEMEAQDNLNDAVYYWNQVLVNAPSDNAASDAVKRLTKKIESKQRSVTTNMMYSKSMDLYKNGKYQDARELWNLMLEKDPGNTQIRQMLSELDSRKQTLIAKGDQYSTKGQYALAVKEYGDALRTDPENQLLQQKLALNEKKAAEQETQKTQVTANAKSNMSTKEMDELFSKGLEFYMSQQFDKALECWNAILSKDPGNVRVQSYITNLKNKMKKLDQL